jgi:hypothetical protein
MTHIKLPTIANTLEVSWAIYKKTWDLWIIGIFVAVVASMFVDKSFFIATLFGMFFGLGLLNGRFTSFIDLMKNISLNQIFRFSIASLVFGLFMMFGLLLFILPGIYIAVRYGYIPFRYATNEDKTLEETYHEVKKVTKNILTKYFILNLGLGIILLIATLATFGLGIFITAPLGMISSAYIYKSIFDQVDLN